MLHMSAESTRILQLRDQLATVLDAFEQATGLYANFKTFSDRWRDANGSTVAPSRHGLHRSAFCCEVKSRNYAACLRCDVTDLPTVCFPPEGRRTLPFVRTCHAGADEVILPLWSDSQLAAVLFVGQFVTGRVASGPAAALAELPAEQVDRLLALTLPLRSYLGELLHDLTERQPLPVASRAHVVGQYLRESLATGPKLADLAARLNLSPSRTTHLVRELTERSFQQLVEDHRITLAKDLLANSDGTVAWIARQTGMCNAAYFCRYFKRKTGLTPGAFRRANRRATQV